MGSQNSRKLRDQPTFTSSNRNSKIIAKMPSPSSQLQVTQMLHRGLQQFPDNICTIDVASGRQKTYAEVISRVSKFADSLLRNGMKNEGRVALVMLNSDKYFETFFAASWAGGIVVPINIRLSPMEMVEVFNDCAVEFIIVDDAFAGIINQVDGKVPSLKKFVFAGENEKSLKGVNSAVFMYESMIAESKEIEDTCRGGDDVFGLFYTGGTTGKPKGVMLTHSNILVNAMGHVAVLQYTYNSRYLHSAPMFHLADGASTFGVTFAGGSHVFLPKFDPLQVLEVIEKFRVNKAMMVPVMLTMVLQADSKTKGSGYDCSSLEHLMYGASPMPESLLEPSMKKFPSCKFIQGYGMTETSPAICMLPAECHTQGDPHLRAVGRPVFWAEAKIATFSEASSKGKSKNKGLPEMIELPRGKIGEIVTKGPHVMKGYWNNEKLTNETIVNGWLRTGDGGYMDKEGFIFLVDRLKDMIITGGENVYSAEVENCIMKFVSVDFPLGSNKNSKEPIVAMCAVIGLPDVKLGEKVSAFVVLKDQGTIKSKDDDEKLRKELIAWCRERIGGYKVPREVFFRKELPVSGAGKILKNELRKEFGTDALGKTTSNI